MPSRPPQQHGQPQPGLQIHILPPYRKFDAASEDDNKHRLQSPPSHYSSSLSSKPSKLSREWGCSWISEQPSMADTPTLQGQAISEQLLEWDAGKINLFPSDSNVSVQTFGQKDDLQTTESSDVCTDQKRDGASSLLGLSPERSSASNPIIQRNPLGQVAAKAAEKALKWLAKRGAGVSNHIFRRHVAKNIARYLTKSKFLQDKFVKKWIQKALKNPDNVVHQGRRIVFEKSLGRKIGKGGEKIIRVVVDKATGKIVTAFPAKAFKVLGVAAVTTAATGAAEADAAILARRKAIAEAEAARENWLTTIIDFVVAPSRVARDEDILAEENILERAIHEAISKIEEAEQRSLSPEEIIEVREIILLEMETTPSAG